MNIRKQQNIFLILANNLQYLSIALLYLGVFLLPNIVLASSISPENIIKFSNEERVKNGVPPLSTNQLLTKAAYKKADAIFKEQSFQHNFGERRFSQWIRDAGYEYQYVGENLAIDFLSSEGVLEGWKNSPTHFENIINKNFNETGVAVKTDIFNNTRSTLIVQIFGTPLKYTHFLNIEEEKSPIIYSENSLKYSLNTFSKSENLFYNDSKNINNIFHTNSSLQNNNDIKHILWLMPIIFFYIYLSRQSNRRRIF